MKRNQMGREIKEKKKTGRERNRKHKRNKNGKKAEKKKNRETHFALLKIGDPFLELN